ncbi:metal-dependent hydrolase [Bacteroidetes bacterium endosymbiont of Geopemphigus sp.]|uniref:metal-dependent hydrolase n=1 Tax=Bacteroidetes bacterium endosymbiont of Geopemphigus sp. TaxID=2047937 RepID=UPI000CD321FE|nr:metal-dependent hydrolase [Bacteroidetes bacterium endosymbiont of Geopemphigus sp.]
MKLRFYAHATYSIECAGKHLLVDPFFTGNPVFSQETALVRNYLENLKADYILVTHAHFDHITDVASITRRTGATVISNYEITAYFEKIGVTNTLGMNFGGFKSFDFGKLKYVWAAHSSVFPDGTHGGNPGGFLLSSEGKNIYIAGDTALSQEMKLIPFFVKPDLAVLPLGGLFTMDIDEAIMASDFIQCNRVLGVHYDTFESIEIDHRIALEKFSAKGKQLLLLKRDQQINI